MVILITVSPPTWPGIVMRGPTLAWRFVVGRLECNSHRNLDHLITHWAAHAFADCLIVNAKLVAADAGKADRHGPPILGDASDADCTRPLARSPFTCPVGAADELGQLSGPRRGVYQFE
jgi:hypothetical protein